MLLPLCKLQFYLKLTIRTLDGSRYEAVMSYLHSGWHCSEVICQHYL